MTSCMVLTGACAGAARRGGGAVAAARPAPARRWRCASARRVAMVRRHVTGSAARAATTDALVGCGCGGDAGFGAPEWRCAAASSAIRREVAAAEATVGSTVGGACGAARPRRRGSRLRCRRRRRRRGWRWCACDARSHAHRRPAIPAPGARRRRPGSKRGFSTTTGAARSNTMRWCPATGCPVRTDLTTPALAGSWKPRARRRRQAGRRPDGPGPGQGDDLVFAVAVEGDLGAGAGGAGLELQALDFTGVRQVPGAARRAALGRAGLAGRWPP